MKVIKATDYGFRKVIQICLNPDDPEWVHIVGEPLRGPDGTPISKADGTPELITDPNVPPGEDGTTCHNCRYNWKVQEFIWTGEQLYTTGRNGQRRPKTNTELLAEIKSQLQPPASAAEITGLINLTLE